MINTIDLHMHSKHSLDGEKSVQQLVDIAKESGIDTIAIADHNSTKAYRDSYDTKGVTIIPAIELDCQFQGKDFHILGYGIDPYNPIWDEICDNVDSMEKNSGLARLDIITNQLGIQVDMDMLKKLRPNGIYEAESVCEVALSMKENDDNPCLLEFRPGKKHGISPYVDFFWEYCAKGKIAYAPMEFMPMEKAIEIFKSQGAKVVLAHPGNNVKEDDALLEDIIALGIDGMEVYSSYHSKEQIDYYKEACLKHNLMMSAGSDYHGKTKPHVYMGMCRMEKDKEQALKEWIES